jgi:Sulfotransferase family
MPETHIDGAIAAPQLSHHNTPEKVDGEEYVRWAYRLLLGREPENMAVVQNNPFKNDRQRLVESVLNSEEFQTRYKEQTATSNNHPYATWYRDTFAFIHVPKTGGTTLHKLLIQCFPLERVCKQRFEALHLYSPAALKNYDLFSGHFDYFSIQFIPRSKVRCVSIFREPVDRLLSWYRFKKSHPITGEFANDVFALLANKLSAEDFFEHDIITLSTFVNNAYLFFFGASLLDNVMIRVIADNTSTFQSVLEHNVVDEVLQERGTGVELLARAVERVRSLDALGLTEKFDDSVKMIFTDLGLPIPKAIISEMVTDAIPDSDPRFARVPPVVITPRLSGALQKLTRYDQIIYNVAKREFERRCSAT